MSAVYRLAQGHNNAAGLALIAPQPRTPRGIILPPLRYAAAGRVKREGKQRVELEWSVLLYAQLVAVLALAGLTMADDDGLVTIQLPKNDGSSTGIYNGTLVVPEVQRGWGWWEPVTISVFSLVELV